MKQKRVKPDPFSPEARYLRTSNRKLYALIAVVAVLSIVFVIM